jgi:long-chain-fatty-acid---luciferin-component ligase
MFDDLIVDHSLVLTPSPTQSNLWVAQALAFFPDLFDDVTHGLDLYISANLAGEVMTGEAKQRSASLSTTERGQITVGSAIKWLERYHKTNDTIRLFTFPFLLLGIMEALEQLGKHFEFGERGFIMTGGGWKLSEDKRISPEDFRKRVEETFGIPETHSFDAYAMVELNGACVHCPEGHFLHIPYPWLKPFVLDQSLKPVGYGEWGRFAFLDAIPGSYPGFIMTGDEVRMLERCPVCDRPGPVLEPSVRRAPGQEMRGCAEEVRRVIEQDIGGSTR